MVDILYPYMRISKVNNLEILSHVDTSVHMASYSNSRYSSNIKGRKLTVEDLLELYSEVI